MLSDIGGLFPKSFAGTAAGRRRTLSCNELLDGRKIIFFLKLATKCTTVHTAAEGLNVSENAVRGIDAVLRRPGPPGIETRPGRPPRTTGAPLFFENSNLASGAHATAPKFMLCAVVAKRKKHEILLAAPARSP
jgi:hypothetical protein